ncbi:MAG: hypothetical protein ACKO1U_03205, partial [Bacteroidota bacterium]
MLRVDGFATATFSGLTPGAPYWIAVRHRNSIATWSAAPVTMTPVTNYDFTTSASQAFGDNMKEVETGVWAFYTGDIYQDEFVDSFDYTAWETDNLVFAAGYFGSDLNGDGFVDSFDYTAWESNNLSFVMSSHP